MTGDRLKPGGALEGELFLGFLGCLAGCREPRPGDQVGPFRICSELGRGGSSVVFLAERIDGAFSQRVALKCLRCDRPVPGGREMLGRERELLASLDHPHIARLVDGGEREDGQPWFAMDYVAGDPIEVHAERLDLSGRVRLVRTVCRAVQHAHGRGLIHGDIKPANIRIDARGRPRLLDFGIARLDRALGRAPCGLTPDYASPEQRRGECLTTASDVWQLGRLLTRMLHGNRLPAALAAICRRATAFLPAARYPSAADLAADLEAWLEDRPVAAHGGGVAYRLALLMRRNRAASAVSLSALLLALGAGFWISAHVAAERDLAQLKAEHAEAALIEVEAVLAQARRAHAEAVSCELPPGRWP